MNRRKQVFARSRILVTRAEPRNGPLCRALRAEGARVIHCPVYRIELARHRAMRAFVARLAEFDWLVFTSAHAVEALQALGAPGRRGRLRPRVAVVGVATAEAARDAGWRVALRPGQSDAQSLVRALIAKGVRGKRVALPLSSHALPTLRTRLKAAGAEVDVVEAYRLRPIRRSRVAWGSAVGPGIDAVTFTSPSTIEGLESSMGRVAFRRLLDRTPAVVMGRTTAAALADRGWVAARVASPTTLSGLVNGLRAVVSSSSLPRGEIP